MASVSYNLLKKYFRSPDIDLMDLKNDQRVFVINFFNDDKNYNSVSLVLEGIKDLQPNFDPTYMYEERLIAFSNIEDVRFLNSKNVFEWNKGRRLINDILAEEGINHL